VRDAGRVGMASRLFPRHNTGGRNRRALQPALHPPPQVPRAGKVVALALSTAQGTTLENKETREAN